MMRPLLAAVVWPIWLISLAWAETPPLPATPVAVTGLLSARSFTLQTPFRYDWSADRLEVREGMMLVIECDPALIRPRETQEPVLFVGRYPAQRVAPQPGSNRLVVLVPAVVDLAKEPIWFGTPGLPEAIDAEDVRRERALAASAQIVPLSLEVVDAALRAGGSEARFATKAELSWALHDLVTRSDRD
jgi:hypothetical protein